MKRLLGTFDYIKLDSLTNARRVKTRVANIIKAIPSNPMMYRADELKSNNDGTYRVFNRDSIRVSYKIEPTAIIIARVRHSSQESISY